MSDWVTLVAIFWALWALDGVRLVHAGVFGFVAWWGGRRCGLTFGRISWPSPWPGGWRIVASDPPLSLSPAGVANRPAGPAARPAEAPAVAQAARWEEVNEVRAAGGWLVLNGRKFCRDTGHVSAAQLATIAKLPEAARAEAIAALVRGWFRPLRVRRQLRVLRGRTETAVACNAGLLLAALLATARVAVNLPPWWATMLGRALPLLAAYAALLHCGGIAAAWWARRRLRLPGSGSLFSALLLPPQALRLRAALGAEYLAAQHPLSIAAASGDAATREQVAFQTLADLRWPVPAERDPALAREIAVWFRERLAAEAGRMLATAELTGEKLLAAPAPDGPDSCRYCPRCRDQFTSPEGRCPHGIALRPLSGG